LQCRAAPDRSRNRRRFSRVGLLRRRCSDRWTEALSLDSSCSTNVSFKRGLFRSAFPHRVAAGSSRASRAWIRGGAGLAKLWRRFWKRPGSRCAAVSAASASWEHCVSETAREPSGCAPISTRWPCSRRPIAPPSGRSDGVTSSIISSRARVQPNSRTAASQIIARSRSAVRAANASPPARFASETKPDSPCRARKRNVLALNINPRVIALTPGECQAPSRPTWRKPPPPSCPSP
jgi:hypothetical protein